MSTITKEYLKKLLKEEKSIPNDPLKKTKEKKDIEKFDTVGDVSPLKGMNTFSVFSVLLALFIVYMVHMALSNIIWTITIFFVVLLLAYKNEMMKRESIINYFKWKLSKIEEKPTNYNANKMYFTIGISLLLALSGAFFFIFQKQTDVLESNINLIESIEKRYDSLQVIKVDSIQELIVNADVYIQEKNKSTYDNINKIENDIKNLKDAYKNTPWRERDGEMHNKNLADLSKKANSLYDYLRDKKDERIVELKSEKDRVIQQWQNNKEKEIQKIKNKEIRNDDKNANLNYFLLIITFVVETLIVYFGYSYAKNFCKFEYELQEYKKYLLETQVVKELKNTLKFLDQLYINFSKGSIVPNVFLERMNSQYKLKPVTGSNKLAEMTKLMQDLNIYTPNSRKKVVNIDKKEATENLFDMYVPLVNQEING